jgi:hypothetical protein
MHLNFEGLIQLLIEEKEDLHHNFLKNNQYYAIYRR